MTNKSITKAYLLWVITGILGGHRWYLGKRWSALAMSIGGTSLSVVLLNTAYQYSPQDAFLTVVELYSSPIVQILSLSSSKPILILFVLFIMAPLFLIPVTLIYDLILIYLKLKKQPQNLTKRQVEVFD